VPRAHNFDALKALDSLQAPWIEQGRENPVDSDTTVVLPQFRTRRQTTAPESNIPLQGDIPYLSNRPAVGMTDRQA
jgi:hypothetical protein